MWLDAIIYFIQGNVFFNIWKRALKAKRPWQSCRTDKLTQGRSQGWPPNRNVVSCF